MRISTPEIEYYLKIHQQQSGTPWLLMLHGFMGSGRVFNRLMPFLKSYCNPVTLDLAGHGKTGHATGDERFSTRNLVNDLDFIIGQLPNQPLYVYGYSMGGRLAFQYAALHNNKLKGLILESSTCGYHTQKEARERKRADRKRAHEIEQNFQQFLNHWRQLPLFNTGRSPDAKLIQIYKQVQEQQSNVQMARCLRGFGTGCMPLCQHRIKKVDLPVLLMAGEADKKFKAINTAMHGLLPKSDLAIVPQAGHRIHLNRPELLAEHIHQFISK